MSAPTLRRLVVLGFAVLLVACRGGEPSAVPQPLRTETTAGTEEPSSPASVPDPAPTREPTTEPTTEPTPGPAGGAEPAERCEGPRPCYGEPERLGRFDAETVPQASGLAASRRNPDVLYLLDDRPGTAEVWVVRTDGTMLGALRIDGMDARDGEALAVGPCGPGDDLPCLYVGDIGDNLRNRDHIVVHRLPEPDLADGPPDEPLAATRARLRYPDGPHDAEALLVDDGARLHIVTKAPFDREERRTGEARLYRADALGDGVLTDLGTVPVSAPAEPLQSAFVGNVVTGGSYRPGRVLLRTYDQVLEYRAPETSDDPAADLSELSHWTVRAVPSPPEPQSEAITWAPERCGYLTAGEMVGDLWSVPCVP